MKAKLMKNILIASFVIVLLQISAILIGSQINLIDDNSNSPFEVIPLSPASETSEGSLVQMENGLAISHHPQVPSRGSRGDVLHAEEPFDLPKEGTQFSNDSVLIGSATNGDLDWFFTQSLRDPPGEPAPLGQIYNITISASTGHFSGFSSVEDWILVRLYTHIDYNSNNQVDDRELILLHQESYNYWNSGPTTWANSCHLGDYYICVEGRPKTATTPLDYGLSVIWYAVNPPMNDVNYNMDKATQITSYTPVKDKFIDMDHQPFDWYSIDAPTDPDILGVNVTIKVKIDKPSPPVYTDGTATFVTELSVVILHEQKDGKLINGGIGNASSHKILNLEKFTDHYHSHIYTSSSTNKRIVKSYIGIYAVTYGVDIQTKLKRFYDGTFDSKDEDAALNSWLKYSFVKVGSDAILRPELVAVGVFSARTNQIYGTTFDEYVYVARYQSDANYEPIVIRAHILLGGTKPPIIRDMFQLDPNNTNFRTPTDFFCLIDGIELGQGFYKFQVECYDRHTYAVGSKTDKEIWDGPYVANNIPPQVRDTAIDYLEMNEDDKRYYIKLKDIFVDADDDQLHYYLLDEDGNHINFLQTNNIKANIVNNEKLRLEPLTNQFGKSILYIEASDKVDPVLNATYKLAITINPINDAPIIKTPIKKIYFFGEVRFAEDTSYNEFNLSEVFWDPIEWDPLKFSVEGNENVFVKIWENGSVWLSAEKNWSGVEVLKFTAMDPTGGSVSDELKVKIEPVNDPPILNHTADIIAYEEAWTNLTFQAWDPADEDPLFFSTDVGLIISLKDDEYFFNQQTGELKLFPPNRVATGKSYQFSVTVRDQPAPLSGKSISVTKYVNITIRNTWDDPTAVILEPKNGDKFLHFEPITFRGLCLDDDLKVPEIDEKSKITYEWFSDIDGRIGDTEIIRDWPLTAGKRGQQHTITLKVTDGKEEDYSYIQVWVLKEDERRDTDSDGMPDYWEDRRGLDKYSSADAEFDQDNDNFTNYEEFYYGGDGLATTNDPTDPWDTNEHPPDILIGREQEKTEEDLITPFLFLFLVAIVIIIVIFIINLLITKKVSQARNYYERKRELEDEWKKKQKEREDDLSYGIYSPKKADVLCHKCGHRNKTSSNARPLAVTCEQCDSRGVIY